MKCSIAMEINAKQTFSHNVWQPEAYAHERLNNISAIEAFP